MNKELHQIFKNLSELEPSLRLKSAIFQRITFEQKRQIQRDLILYRVWSLGSLGLVLYTFFAFGSTVLKSEFWDVFTLAFSDLQVVLSNWNDYVLSVMETLPVVNIVIILASVFALMLSLNFYWTLKNKSNFRHYNYV